MFFDVHGRASVVHPIFWAGGTTTNPPIKKSSPTIIFYAAFEGDQSTDSTFD